MLYGKGLRASWLGGGICDSEKKLYRKPDSNKLHKNVQ